jgi:hypothetical protein
MTIQSPANSGTTPAADGRIFGIPFGDLGLFATVLFSFALAFTSFFATTFVSIFAILFYNTAGHHTVDLADAYKWIALPVGLVVLAVSLVTLGFFWIRRKVRGN